MENFNHLEKLRWHGDQHADTLVSAVIDFEDMPNSFTKMSAVFDWFKSLNRNEDLLNPKFPDQMDIKIQKAICLFLKNTTLQPDEFSQDDIHTTQNLFKKQGYLSGLIFLCASLPEVYIIPDIASVLHITGQLEKATEQRIRATATMVLSVLLEQGINHGNGVGLVLTFRARVIHSFLRVLLLRNSPENIQPGQDAVSRITSERPPKNLFEVAYRNGWNIQQSSIPCNQLELIYTLMTFSYVYIRSIKRLRLTISAKEQTAYLNTWNLIGYYMGISKEYLPQNFEQAEILFNEIQQWAKTQPKNSTYLASLGKSLMAPLDQMTANTIFKNLYRNLSEYLTSRMTCQNLHISKPTDRVNYKIFQNFISGLQFTDQKVWKPLFPNFAFSSYLSKKISLNIIKKILLTEGSQISLPEYQLKQVDQLINQWESRNLNENNR
jgi:hypothetical protein